MTTNTIRGPENNNNNNSLLEKCKQNMNAARSRAFISGCCDYTFKYLPFKILFADLSMMSQERNAKVYRYRLASI